jgi:hypothetical protein
MQNPRGSNDRLNEANTNRNNANRLFDSQNNAKGGFCYGPSMTYYEKSLLTVEWTSQHGCGNNPKLVCNMVIQYMCGSANADATVQIRDGETTNTIPANVAGATATGTTGLLYGMHESLQNYLDCNTRQRNMGLYIADRATEGGLTAGRASAIYTRQNNNGNRHGLECAEKRDYYPYWHPSEWKDIAILTANTDWCDFYKAESQNVKSKGYCQDKANPGVQVAPNNEAVCSQTGTYEWVNKPAWGLNPPDCILAPFSRENHLGHGTQQPGHNNNYNWTLPAAKDETCIGNGDCNCVLRMRYNVSTTEDGFPDMSNPTGGFLDWTNNADNSPVTQDLWINGPSNSTFLLATDTTQYGRTFEDRSHVFHIAKRPSGVTGTARLFNLNVRGKRGNIVQAYPATEYDFAPQFLTLRVGDYVHFQWTGCDTNPAGNAGEGTDGTDRSNMIQIVSEANNIPVTDDQYKKGFKPLFEDANVRLRFATLDQTNCAANPQDISEQDVTNCALLNAAEPYFDGGVFKMNKTGIFHYMSTRNHNFTNRDQKGSLTVLPLLPKWALGVVLAGAALFVGAGAVAFMMFYAKNNPHSGIANVFSKM